MSRPAAASGGSRWRTVRAVVPEPRGLDAHRRRLDQAGLAEVAAGRRRDRRRHRPTRLDLHDRRRARSARPVARRIEGEDEDRLPTESNDRLPALTSTAPSTTTRPTSRSSPARSIAAPSARVMDGEGRPAPAPTAEIGRLGRRFDPDRRPVRARAAWLERRSWGGIVVAPWGDQDLDGFPDRSRAMPAAVSSRGTIALIMGRHG